MKINIKQFFTVTSILLILFAAGLIAHGVHEFNEAKLIAPVVENIWNTNGVLDEKGFFGGMAKSLFGYNGNPSMSEVASYWLYLIAVFIYWRSVDSPKIQRKED